MDQIYFFFTVCSHTYTVDGLQQQFNIYLEFDSWMGLRCTQAKKKSTVSPKNSLKSLQVPTKVQLTDHSNETRT